MKSLSACLIVCAVGLLYAVLTLGSFAETAPAMAHVSPVIAGFHQHYFYGATATLSVNPGEVLFQTIYLDPLTMPREVMLQWKDGNWEHRAYWGEDLIDLGTGRVYMGPLPASGQWVRLEVPASLVGLEGHVLNGLAFSLYDGRATWDHAGKAAP